MKQVHSPLIAGLRLGALLVWVLALTPALILFSALGWRSQVQAVAKRIYRGLIWVMGIRIEQLGQICRDHPVLYVCNHFSYLDIPVLGARLDASFVAKKEVAGWPGIGPMARIAGTMFVERRARHSKTQSAEMSARLQNQQSSLILFPEGTSSNGQGVLQFKSALFSVASATALPVQPISLAYTRLDGMPLGRGWRPHYAWYGDMDLASHLWMVLGIGKVTVTVIYHRPVTLDQFGSRKGLADYCEKQVRRGVIAANRGYCAEFVDLPPPVAS